LGSAHRGELVYAGSVRPKLAESELKALTEMLKAIEIKKPFIKIQTEATWVQAKYTCRVIYGKRNKTGRLQDIEWDKMLGRIENAQ
jgi:ATP-dependent DNA ligase